MGHPHTLRRWFQLSNRKEWWSSRLMTHYLQWGNYEGEPPQGTILGNFLFVMTTNKIENQINITVQDARTSQDPVPSMPMTPERLTFNPLNNPDLVSMPTTQDNLRYSSHQLPKTRMTVSIFWTECNEYGRIWILLKLGSWGPFPWSRSSSRQPPRTLSNL